MSTMNLISSQPAADRAAYATVDAYVEEQMRRLKIPGASLAIVEGDRIVHRRGFGRARPGGAAPSPQTPFVLGSTTKSFTALAVMQLVEAEKIDLDAPIQRYLPWFRVADLEASSQITVRHLLNQAGGLPMLPGMTGLADFDDLPGATERQARALSTLKLTRPAGAAFEYSNLNYNLLGLIVEAVSGESYGAYIQHRVFIPLEMSHSYTSQVAARQGGLAMGHRYWFAQPVAEPDLPIPRGSLPSGQLISCSEDMAHYLIAHLNGGRRGNVQILSSAGMDELHRGAAAAVEMGVDMGRYAMGWFATDIGGAKAIWHTGNVPDFSSYMVLLPEQKQGAVLLVNADHYGLPPILTGVGWGLTALLAGQQPPPMKLGSVPWVMRALPLLPLLQIAGAAATLLMLRRWRRDPALRPGPGRTWSLHILLPLVPNLSLAAIPIYLWARGMLGFMSLFMPDISAIALISGGLAGLWAVVRTGLMLQTLRWRRPHHE
jgi:CubicO group peptidase (beta-lactamase class C family)